MREYIYLVREGHIGFYPISEFRMWLARRLHALALLTQGDTYECGSYCGSTTCAIDHGRPFVCLDNDERLNDHRLQEIKHYHLDLGHAGRIEDITG